MTESGGFRRRRSAPHGPRRLGLLVAVALCACLFALTAEAQSGYELGHGYSIAAFNLAGYSEVAAGVAADGQQKITLEDFSLFVTGHVNRLFNPFVEAELIHLDLTRSDPSAANHRDGVFVLERLYDDAELTDSLTLRFGKMLAPVGAWNVIHAAPLVLTTIRPAVTYRNFSEYLTGASLIYSNPDGGPGFQVYWQPDGEFSERPRSLTYDQYKSVAGLHVTAPLSLLDQIGFSYQRSTDMANVTQSLFGGDFKYAFAKFTLQGEATYSSFSGGGSTRRYRDEMGAYLAGSYALNEKWSVYSWYEGFSSRNHTAASRDLLVGVAFHPLPAMSIKLEYLQNVGGPPVNPTGLFASVSVLY